MKKYLIGFCLSILGASCVSVQKHNDHISREIPVENLQKDIDFVKKKLLKKHTDIDLYLPKDSIVFKLDSLKNSLKTPMKPNDFSRELSKVISQFGHGHTYVSRLIPKLTRQEKKTYGYQTSVLERAFPVVQYVDGRFLLKSLIFNGKREEIYAEVLAIDSITFGDFLKKNKGIIGGDGKTRTLEKYVLAEIFWKRTNADLFKKDSITLTLRKKDSVFTKVIQRNSYPREVIDTLKPKKLSKAQQKHQQKVRKYFVGSNPDQYVRNIIFPVKNDSSIAVLRVRNFRADFPKKAYEFIFDSIQKAKVQHLILDLRNNSGGFVSNTEFLYGHLSNLQKNVIADTSKVKSKFSVVEHEFSYLKKFNIFSYVFRTPFSAIFSISDILKTRKSEDGNYYYHFQEKHKSPKIKYLGNLYVLINGGSYSMAAVLSASLQGENRAVFIGEETGGDFNGTVAGRTLTDKLKYSKLHLSYGLMTLKPNVQRSLKGRGVLPDISVQKSFEDALNEKDTQLEAVIEYIKKNKSEKK